MLNHTSGWGHYWDHPYYQKHLNEFETHADFLEFIKTIPLQFNPGRQYQYSNVGYLLLGAIIEKVSGQSYEAFIKSKVFSPIGMKTATIAKTNDNHYAIPYTLSKQQISHTQRGWADGGAYSCLNDLGLLLKEVFIAQRYCSENMIKELLDGFREEEDELFEITGGFPGSSTALMYHEPSGYALLVLSNLDPPMAEEVAKSIINLILEKELENEIIKVQGSTFNHENGEAIAYTNIGILNKGIGTASKADGKFLLEIPAKHVNDTLVFSALGYQRVFCPNIRIGQGTID